VDDLRAELVRFSVYIGFGGMQGEVRYIPGAGAGAHSQGREATRRCRTLATSPIGGSCSHVHIDRSVASGLLQYLFAGKHSAGGRASGASGSLSALGKVEVTL
jgi:hypothetical protein